MVERLNVDSVNRVNVSRTDSVSTGGANNNSKPNSVFTAQQKTQSEAPDNAKTEAENSESKKADSQSPEKKSEEKSSLNEYTDYTVQEGESFRGLIKRSLIAQNKDKENYEPTDEEIEKAIEDFKANNPEGTVKTAKNGVMYLLAGAKVKLAGGLEDKNNGAEQEAKWLERVKGAQEGRGGVSETSEEPNLRKTWVKDVYYDEQTKTHYKKSADGNYVKMEPHNEGGRITQVNKDGSYYEKLVYTDGSGSKSCLYSSDGKLKQEIVRDKNGKLMEVYKYYSNGVAKRVSFYDHGKNFEHREYYENGNEKRKLFYGNDGSCYMSIVYNKDGKVLRERDYKTGSSYECSYYDNGNKKEEIWRKKGKVPQTRHYHPDGSVNTHYA